ncbi:MAG: hypothetical protein JNM81_00740 [Rhodospirillaceae bacterium]|nr:hypothetical protein [Rhodospirillaceae bacterium]
MDIYQEDVLRWLHILAVVYWLGGEWGVFQSSFNTSNRSLPIEERRRHFETAYRIDIMARSGIILLLPLGVHMGFNLGAHPWGGEWLVLNWVLGAAWLALAWAAFIHRYDDLGLKLTMIDEKWRYILIPALMITSVYSLYTGGPLTMKWYAGKVFVYSLMLVIGLVLRFIMRQRTQMFRKIELEGNTPALEQRIQNHVRLGRTLAYFYWIGIMFTAFLGATKPF